MSKADVGQIQSADRQHTRSPLDEMLSVPLFIASLPPIISEALGRSSLNVAFASERVSELATSAELTVMVSVAEPLIVAESVDFGGPPERVQSLAKFQLPLTPRPSIRSHLFSSPLPDRAHAPSTPLCVGAIKA
jgi:hypothetical protein